jgi:hypothetical protein
MQDVLYVIVISCGFFVTIFCLLKKKRKMSTLGRWMEGVEDGGVVVAFG